MHNLCIDAIYFDFGFSFSFVFNELCMFWNQVSQFLRSKNWDTRVAAAHAIGAIAQNVKHTCLTELFSCVETKMSEAGISGTVEDVVAWPNFHSKIVASVSFRRLSMFFIYKTSLFSTSTPVSKQYVVFFFFLLFLFFINWL